MLGRRDFRCPGRPGPTSTAPPSWPDSCPDPRRQRRLTAAFMAGLLQLASAPSRLPLMPNSHRPPDTTNHRRRHHHHHGRVAGEGRRVVAPPCPRSTARLQSSPVGRRVESFRSWSSHLSRGRPGGRRHVRSGHDKTVMYMSCPV